MNKLTAYLLIILIPISASSGQRGTSKSASLTSSESLASDMGKTFQLAQNCKQDMSNISDNNVVLFFNNFFDKNKVEKIMKQYRFSVDQHKGKACNREKINFPRLMIKMADYMRVTRP